MKHFLKLTAALILGVAFSSHSAVTIWGTKDGFGQWLSAKGFQLAPESGLKEYLSLDADPTAGGGVAAPVGSLGVRDNSGVGELWLKTGSDDDAWGQVISSNGAEWGNITGTLSDQTDLKSALDSKWSTTGNASTNPATNFIGTTDNQPLVFKTDNVERWRLNGNVLQGSATTSFVRGGVGLAGTPTYSFYDDTDTGMYRGGTNSIAFSTNGTLSMHITADGGIGLGGSASTSARAYVSSNANQSQSRGFFDATTLVAANNQYHSFQSFPSLPQTAETFTQVDNFYATVNNNFGTGLATVSELSGFNAYSSIGDATRATNRAGFRGNISSTNAGSYNLYMSGTAPNYIRGNVGIGLNSTSGNRPAASVPPTNLYITETTPNIRLQDAAVGATAITAGMAGTELVSMDMNTTSKYTPALKFGSGDQNFTAVRFGAYIAGESTQNYSNDTTVGMGLGFFTTANTTSETPVQALQITQNQRLKGVDGSAADPTYGFQGGNSGMYRTSTNDLVFATGGVARLTVDPTGEVGIGGTATADALLSLTSTTQGFLPPRVTSVQKNAISSPSDGLIVYDTDQKAINTFDGSNWVSLSVNASFVTGDIKKSIFSTVDAGWVLLNGETIGNSSSGASQRANDDTIDLFIKLWNEFDNSVLPIFNSDGSAGTRGASAIDDFNANKRLRLFDYQALVARGSGTQTFGANTKTGPALGAKQEDQMQGHKHSLEYNNEDLAIPGANVSGGSVNWFLGNSGHPNDLNVGNPRTASGMGTPRVGAETRVSSFGVNWLMKL